mmetsp:Transcript_13219/g.25280  ORF Transcript_13219/g.25280 Transcript_13219/m.25280 type:complete len:270 (-) Transcript_13219:183-992(-)
MVSKGELRLLAVRSVLVTQVLWGFFGFVRCKTIMLRGFWRDVDRHLNGVGLHLNVACTGASGRLARLIWKLRLLLPGINFLDLRRRLLRGCVAPYLLVPIPNRVNLSPLRWLRPISCLQAMNSIPLIIGVGARAGFVPSCGLGALRLFIRARILFLYLGEPAVQRNLLHRRCCLRASAPYCLAITMVDLIITERSKGRTRWPKHASVHRIAADQVQEYRHKIIPTIWFQHVRMSRTRSAVYRGTSVVGCLAINDALVASDNSSCNLVPE